MKVHLYQRSPFSKMGVTKGRQWTKSPVLKVLPSLGAVAPKQLLLHPVALQLEVTLEKVPNPTMELHWLFCHRLCVRSESPTWRSGSFRFHLPPACPSSSSYPPLPITQNVSPLPMKTSLLSTLTVGPRSLTWSQVCASKKSQARPEKSHCGFPTLTGYSSSHFDTTVLPHAGKFRIAL